ncbi:hypothetical protein ACWGJX_33350 [Streptomyces sp. NPDC054775]
MPLDGTYALKPRLQAVAIAARSESGGTGQSLLPPLFGRCGNCSQFATDSEKTMSSHVRGQKRRLQSSKKPYRRPALHKPMVQTTVQAAVGSAAATLTAVLINAIVGALK